MHPMIEAMEKLNTDDIISVIEQTWNMPEGIIVRDVAFYVIENREGEEVSDIIYKNIWNKFQN